MQKSKAVIIFISVIFILCVLLTVDENIIDVTFYSYNNKKLPESFNDFTIVHLSDLHYEKNIDIDKFSVYCLIFQRHR